jgi:branched-chain amino acid aminotransferase
MNEGKFILVDGSFVLSAEYRISLAESEGFLFSEKIRSVRTAFPFFKETLEMVKLKLLIFKQDIPELTKNEGAGLKRQMERTVTKNKHFMGSVVSLRFWIFEQKPHYSIQSSKCEIADYELNLNGLYIDIFRKIEKSISSLSNISIGSEALWLIADNHLRDNDIDQFLLLNTENRIIEAIRSNVYLIKNEEVKGASIYQGAYVDISKPLILKIFDQLNLGYNENDGITEQDLKEADEIFLVNAIDGIRWVVGLEGKRYFNHTIRKINELFVSSLIS